jgi:hypothetical protein
MSANGDSTEGIGWETPVTAQPVPAAATSAPSGLVAEHPEVIAGAAFVGGLLTALIVRRLGR